MESSSFHDIQVEATRKLEKWDENMDSAEEVVYSSFLVGAAREAGVDVDGLVKLPMMNVEVKDQSVQVSVPCPDCVIREIDV